MMPTHGAFKAPVKTNTRNRQPCGQPHLGSPEACHGLSHVWAKKSQVSTKLMSSCAFHRLSRPKGNSGITFQNRKLPPFFCFSLESSPNRRKQGRAVCRSLCLLISNASLVGLISLRNMAVSLMRLETHHKMAALVNRMGSWTSLTQRRKPTFMGHCPLTTGVTRRLTFLPPRFPHQDRVYP